MIRVFISHSHRDVALAAALADLIRHALPLRSDEIRCTSVPGHKLPGGAHTATQLRREVQHADVLVGLVSTASLDSLYVAFELGARWGTQGPLIPLFAPGFDLAAMRGPLAEYSGLRLDDAADLHQFVRDLADLLEVESEPADAYHRALQAVLDVPVPEEPVPTKAAPPASSPTGEAGAAANPGDPYAEAEAVARRHCEAEWEDDFAMLDYCLRQQREAVDALRRGKPDDVPGEVFERIRWRAAKEWPEDFTMRVYVEKQQLDAYRRTRGQ